jgi:hypothetical protein
MISCKHNVNIQVQLINNIKSEQWTILSYDRSGTKRTLFQNYTMFLILRHGYVRGGKTSTIAATSSHLFILVLSLCMGLSLQYRYDFENRSSPVLLKIRKINRFLLQNSNLEIWGETKNRAILSVYRSVFLVYQMVFGRFFLNSIFK